MTYQDRYIKHQEKKKRQLMYSEGVRSTPIKANASLEAVLNARRSQRVFNGEKLTDKELNKILAAATTAPNSCNRHGLKMKVIKERDQKELLGGLLVGGVGWIHRADTIVLFLADMTAYASPNEKKFMHYCDVGFTATQMWLTAESLNIGASYINPNVKHQEVFNLIFGKGLVFCGALVLGKYDRSRRARKADPGDLKDMLI